MTVLNYLIHFNEKLHHAQHYHGSTNDLEHRLREHAQGTGAKLMAAIKERGITWQLASTWPGGYDVEKAQKLQHNSPRRCPICREKKFLERMFEQ
jgi:hypothetical protein